MQQLEARIEALSTFGGELEGIEERIMGNVEDMIADAVAGTTLAEPEVDSALAPLVQSLAAAQLDMQANLDVLAAKVDDTLAPFVQSLAASQLDLQATLDGFEAKVDGALAPLMQSIAIDQVDFRTRLDSLAERVNSLDEATAEHDSFSSLLTNFERADSAALNERVQALESFNAAALTAKVSALEERVAAAAKSFKKEARAQKAPTQEHAAPTALELDLDSEVRAPAFRIEQAPPKELLPLQLGKSHLRLTSDGKMQWSDGKKCDHSSEKVRKGRHHETSWQRGMEPRDAEWGNAFAVPFARAASGFAPNHHLERLSCSRSAPVLPPVF